MENGLAPSRITAEQFRYGARVSAVQKNARQSATKCREMFMMAYREYGEMQILPPKAVSNRDELEAIPEIGPPFGQRTRIIGDSTLNDIDQMDRYEQPDAPVVTLLKIGAIKQVLEVSHMVHMTMGDEHSFRELPMIRVDKARKCAWTAVKEQAGSPVALKYSCGTAEVCGVGIADAEKEHGVQVAPIPATSFTR